MNKIATLIVIDDSTEAYQLCRQLSPELVGTILDLNLNYSRSITQDDISRSIKRNSEDFITYEEMSSYLSSTEVSKNLILILDLGFFFEANFQREINNEYFSAYAGLDSIPDDQVEGLTLGIKAIKNINIKNLMIFYATGRALNEPGYKCLVKESKQFNILHPEPKLLRKITYLPEFGSPFVIADSARARRLGHAKSFLLNVAVQWTEFLEQSQIETETTDESDKSPQFKLIITGKKIMDERGYPGGLIIKVSRPGTDIKRRPINTPTTVKFARIIYEAIQAEDNFIPYGDIYLYADSTLPYKNGEFPVEGTESYDKAIKDEAKKTYNNLQRHLKQHLNILSNNESLSLLFREDIERKEFILMNFSCEIKLES